MSRQRWAYGAGALALFVIGIIFGDDDPPTPTAPTPTARAPTARAPTAAPPITATPPVTLRVDDVPAIPTTQSPRLLPAPSQIAPETTGLPIPRERPAPPQPLQQPSQQIETAYVDASRLNVRRGPGTTFQQVWTLKNNERVTIIARSGDWAQLKGDRYEGWVHGGYLTNRPAPSRPVAVAPPAKLSVGEVKSRLIQRSLSQYSGRCPCPYNIMSNSRRCGRSSAYSRPGGASPLCYPSDITDAMVQAYLARQ